MTCIIESYIYSLILQTADNNVLSAMMYHFLYNLMIHITAIDPSENNGSTVPYILMSVTEAAIAGILAVTKYKRQNGGNNGRN